MASAERVQDAEFLRVFCDPAAAQSPGHDPGHPLGGNPTGIVLGADAMSEEEMQAFARSCGHECGFVLRAAPGAGVDHVLRFWVPEHEMSMCGHATAGIAWLLAERGLLPPEGMRVSTPSGVVHAAASGDEARVKQPVGSTERVPDDGATAVLDVLGVTADDLAGPVRNGTTSRTKTLVPLTDPHLLDRLSPDLDRVAVACDLVGSTGLYPYAVSDAAGRVVDARQFPRGSGYPEDPATGVAAAALAFALLEDGFADRTAEPAVSVRQGRAMGSPSAMTVRFDDTGVWIGGVVRRVP